MGFEDAIAIPTVYEIYRQNRDFYVTLSRSTNRSNSQKNKQWYHLIRPTDIRIPL